MTKIILLALLSVSALNGCSTNSNLVEKKPISQRWPSPQSLLAEEYDYNKGFLWLLSR